MQLAAFGIDDGSVPRLDRFEHTLDLADGGNAERARHDRHMARRPALLEHQAAQALAVVVEQLGRAHGAGDEDGVLRQVAGSRGDGAARQQPEQAVGEIVDVVQPLARMRVDLAEHAGAGVVPHTLHRRLRRQAGEQRLVQPAPPAVVVGEHAERFEHLAMLAGAGEIAPLQHGVDHAGQLLDRLGQAAALELDILGDQAGDDDARLMQHHMAERHAFGDGQPREARGELAARLLADRLGNAEAARGDRLGEHHGGGLERLDLLVAILTLGAVLNREHADRVAAAQDRHAAERVVDFLAGLGPVGERRVMLRVGELQRLGLLGDQANQTLARLEVGIVHGQRVQAFGGEQFERAVAAPQIERAHLGHHVGGDQHHHLVEPNLRALALRHHLAQASQQLSRRANRRSRHGNQSSPTGGAADQASSGLPQIRQRLSNPNKECKVRTASSA